MLFEDKLYCRAETSLRGHFLNGFKRVFKMKKAIRKSRRRKRKVQVYEYSDLYTSCNYQDFTFHDFCQVIKVKLGIVGNIVAFIVALLAIKSFIGFLTKHGFKLFGYYRIIVGGAILILYFLGYELSMF